MDLPLNPDTWFCRAILSADFLGENRKTKAVDITLEQSIAARTAQHQPSKGRLFPEKAVYARADLARYECLLRDEPVDQIRSKPGIPGKTRHRIYPGKSGYQRVQVASDGASAPAAVETGEIDVVLLE
jgi:hypothetical protein